MVSNPILEKHEEMLEMIWNLAEQGEFEINRIKEHGKGEYIDSDFSELEEMGLIIFNENKILFTEKGNQHAEGIVRRHRLTKVLLSSILKMRNGSMNEIACQVEHTLLPEVEEAICILLGHPNVCPDGKAIPPGKCCKNQVKSFENVITSLGDLKTGEFGKVSFIKPVNHSQLHKILSFGLNPGVMVKIHRTTPVFCIKFDNTELAIDKEVAQNIYVVKYPSACSGNCLEQ